MRKLITISAVLFLSIGVWAQSPQSISYQAVIRDANHNLLKSQTVGMQISILQGSASGSTVYSETHSDSTSMNGLVSLEIGTGTVLNGTFAGIDWANGPFFIKTETDPAGGSNYTISGTTQLLSVPYALHANTAGKLLGAKDEFYLGQDTMGGIVYYIYRDSLGAQRGLIVNKTETTEVWQAIGTTTGAGRTDDGEFNTNRMSNSGAATYVATLGAGWYIPSIDELALLFNNRFITNKALRKCCQSTISTSTYWSSTEYTVSRALGMNFGTGTSSSSAKDATATVRAIRSF